MRMFIAVLSIALCGCNPSLMDKAKQDFSCKDKGGVYEYTITNLVICRNGDSVRGWSASILTPDFYPDKEVK